MLGCNLVDGELSDYHIPSHKPDTKIPAKDCSDPKFFEIEMDNESLIDCED